MEKKNVLFLTGAGFSTAFLKYDKYVLNSKFLTDLLCDKKVMEEFYRILYDDSPSFAFYNISELSELLISDLERNHLEDKLLLSPNFEQVFFLLESLINFSPDSELKKANDGLNNYRRDYILSLICTPKPEYYDYIIRVGDLYAFQEFMLDAISLFKVSDDDLELLSKYFYSIIDKHYLKYYTLNYDSLILDILANINKTITDLEITRTFNLGCTYGASGGPIYAKDIFNTNAVFADRKNSLFYLHGSVYYQDYIDTKIIKFENRKPISPKSRNLMNILGMPEPRINANLDGGYRFNQSFITGLNKNIKLTEEPYSSIYTKFRTDLHETEELVIIGYSFNDDHINAILSSTPPKLKKITVVDYFSDSDDIRTKYYNFLNKFISSIKPFGFNQTIELWNMIGLPKNKIEIDEGFENLINNNAHEYDFNGVKDFIVRKINSA